MLPACLIDRRCLAIVFIKKDFLCVKDIKVAMLFDRKKILGNIMLQERTISVFDLYFSLAVVVLWMRRGL